MKRVHVGNCLLFALWRWITRGGYLVIRRSHYGLWPHLIWCRDLRDASIEHFVPLEYANRFAFIYKFLFRGHILREDNIDPTCFLHGKKWSEHESGRCLYCALCFEALTKETCYVSPSGITYDLCLTCGTREHA